MIKRLLSCSTKALTQLFDPCCYKEAFHLLVKPYDSSSDRLVWIEQKLRALFQLLMLPFIFYGLLLGVSFLLILLLLAAAFLYGGFDLFFKAINQAKGIILPQ